MRKLAALAMHSQKHSLFLAVLFACIPIIFWLSTAILSLVILRRGIDHGLKILLWTLLPGIAWTAFGQFGIVIGLMGTTLLACILRQTVSWEKTLLALVPLGAFIAFAIYQLAPELITMIADFVIAFLNKKNQLVSIKDTSENFIPMLQYGIAGALAWVHILFCILSLILARSWQATLYNPGGFGDEFRQVRLSTEAGIILLTIILIGSRLSPIMTALVPIASLPLFIAGLALLHGLVRLRKLSSFWLIGTYVLLITITQLAYPLIFLTACLDSLLNFRNRKIES